MITKNDRPGAATPERSDESTEANNQSTQGFPCADSISDFIPSVKDLLQLKEFRSETGAKARDFVTILEADFPKFSKQCYSMCENPEQYGVVLHPEGFAKLQSLYPAAAVTKKKKKSGKNRLTKRISARLADDEYAALIRKIKMDGFDTMQAFLVFVVRNYLKE